MAVLTRGRRADAPVAEVPIDEGIAVLTRSFESRTVRVNLLPPEIAEARRLRTVQAGIACVALFVAGATGAVWWDEQGKLQNAKDEQATAQMAHDALQGQVTRYAPVDALFKQVDRAQLMVKAAGAGNVDWARLLDGLSERLPQTSWLTNATLAGATAATSASAAAASAATTASPYGTVTLTGAATQMVDGATLLDALAQVPGLQNVYPGSLSVVTGTGGSYVTWSVTAGLTADALLPNHGGIGQ